MMVWFWKYIINLPVSNGHTLNKRKDFGNQIGPFLPTICVEPSWYSEELYRNDIYDFLIVIIILNMTKT